MRQRAELVIRVGRRHLGGRAHGQGGPGEGLWRGQPVPGPPQEQARHAVMRALGPCRGVRRSFVLVVRIATARKHAHS